MRSLRALEAVKPSSLHQGLFVKGNEEYEVFTLGESIGATLVEKRTKNTKDSILLVPETPGSRQRKRCWSPAPSPICGEFVL